MFSFPAVIAQPWYERAPFSQALLADDVQVISESGRWSRTAYHSSVGKREHGSEGLIGCTTWREDI